MVIRADGLPLPEKYCGGFIYSNESSGILSTEGRDEQPLPKQRRFINKFHDDDAVVSARRLLDAATVGTVYEFQGGPWNDDGTEYYDPEDYCRRYRKISSGSWVEMM